MFREFLFAAPLHGRSHPTALAGIGISNSNATLQRSPVVSRPPQPSLDGATRWKAALQHTLRLARRAPPRTHRPGCHWTTHKPTDHRLPRPSKTHTSVRHRDAARPASPLARPVSLRLCPFVQAWAGCGLRCCMGGQGRYAQRPSPPPPPGPCLPVPFPSPRCVGRAGRKPHAPPATRHADRHKQNAGPAEAARPTPVLVARNASISTSATQEDGDHHHMYPPQHVLPIRWPSWTETGLARQLSVDQGQA
ncbi:hypothetical protein PtB15_15B79 [Puccinia triticina]|nr:hypothetical protein PtB15_15B79 [Puccinia triticina]